MNLVRKFYLKDIKEYEDETGNSILKFFNDIKISNLIELIKLGNNNCEDDVAYRILDYYLSIEGNTILTAILEIKEKLLGISGTSDDELVDNNDMIDITKFETLTDLYTHFSMQLMSVGLSYSEFWSMNTKEMYSVFNSICIKMQNETNRELSNYHTLAAMIGGAVWGKLQKDAPRVDFTKNNIEEDNSLEIVAKLKGLATTQNILNNIKKGDNNG